MNYIDQSLFYPASVGKSNVPIQGLKRTKSKGSAVKSEFFVLLQIHRTYEFIYFKNYEIIPVT